MGVAAAARHRCRIVFLSVFLAVSCAPRVLSQTQDQVVFNAESSYAVQEEQPAGTAVISLEAYYVLASPLQLRADGVFALDPAQPEAELFTIESALSQDGSRTLGTIRNSVVMDRDVEGAQTVFSLAVSYSAPNSSLSAQNTVCELQLACRVAYTSLPSHSLLVRALRVVRVCVCAWGGGSK